MRIGLLTTYSFNYGSYHQAIALQKKLQDMGHECELINEKSKMFKCFNLTLLYLLDPILPKFAKQKLSQKIPQYNSYLMIKNDTSKLSISPSGIICYRSLLNQYDCIIVGSDELWSASSDSIRFYPEYFGIGINVPLISYATCAIKLTAPNTNMCDKIKYGLSKFTALSVRDEKSLENVKKIVPNLQISVVIDPTLLNPYFVPKNEIKPSTRYVLLYGQHFDNRQKAFIKDYAKRHNCKIYCVGWRLSFADRFLNVSSAEELQNAFAAAYFCFPSTFHGTIFSILNHRQFVSMLNDLRGEKVKLLLQSLNLENRIYNININPDEKIDYCEVENTLSALRTSSEEFLINALEEIDSNVQKQYFSV